MAKQRAVAYCRVSSKSKAQMHSLGYQTDYWQRAMAESSEYEFVRSEEHTSELQSQR